MPKTIAITPSWYWPESIDRVAGIPPYGIHEICLSRHARDIPECPALIVDEKVVTYGELADRVADRSRSDAVDAGAITMPGDVSIDSIVNLLGALAAGSHVTISAPGEVAGLPGASAADEKSGEGGPGTLPDVHEPVVSIQGKRGIVSHSHRSLLAGAVSMATFLQPDPDLSWLLTCPLNRWEGLLSLLLPLYLGTSVVVVGNTDSESFAGAIARHRPGYALTDLASAVTATREAKRAVKKSREILQFMLLSAPGVFDPGDRQRVGKLFRCAALTLFGLPETGAIFASHPQWYLDESIGIPITNAHVVPADPRNGSPIQTLWELVESAEVTVKGPSLMSRYEDRNDLDYLVDGRFRTGVIASSDANGMIYILPD
jgi:acyl-CoA synthetase (AMP-forming)/AMP-acid ligase II